MEVKFDIETVDSLQGLHSYMNTLVNTNDDLIRFQMRKVSYYWGYHENSYVYYMFAPPWIKLAVVSVHLHFLTPCLERRDKSTTNEESQRENCKGNQWRADGLQCHFEETTAL